MLALVSVRAGVNGAVRWGLALIGAVALFFAGYALQSATRSGPGSSDVSPLSASRGRAPSISNLTALARIPNLSVSKTTASTTAASTVASPTPVFSSPAPAPAPTSSGSGSTGGGGGGGGGSGSSGSPYVTGPAK
jgi:hypothetical protein